MTRHSHDPFAAIAEMARATKIAYVENTAMQQAREVLALSEYDRWTRAITAAGLLQSAAEQITRLKEGRPS